MLYSNDIGRKALVATVFLGVSSAVVVNTSVVGCRSLVANGLSAQVYFPGNSAYIAREGSYWSVDSQLGPECIVQPRNTAEVSLALKTLINAPGNFAVRSGGHSHWAGGSDIHNGITIDLGLMNASTYNPTTTLASVQPGPRWADVFASLAAQGAVVAGGRDGDVGIGGFLTGGGNSYYTGRLGFGCDSVVNFEVVLADGCVINANATANSDLWKALKGGSGNLGIVTRFDLQALPSTNIWGGLRASNLTYAPQMADAIVNFTNANVNNPQDALVVEYTYTPALFPGEVVLGQLIIDTTDVANPPAFDEIQQIPAVLTDLSSRSLYDVSSAYLLPRNNRNVWFTLTFNNDARIINKASDLHNALVAELLELFPPADFNTQCVFQPIPSYFGENSDARGGNVLGLDNVKQNAILWLGTIAVKNATQEAIARPMMAAWYESLQEYAVSIGGSIAFQYLNYADPTQDPFKSYGAANLAFLKEVSAKYDPNGVFQNRMTAGWKISRA